MNVDRIANMLSTIKNVSMSKGTFVETFYTKECENVAKVLKDAGFLENVKVFKHKGKPFKGLRLDLDKEIMEAKRLSKPGRRLYIKSADIKLVKGGRGVLVVSTPKGIMSGKEAKEKNLGGELICLVS